MKNNTSSKFFGKKVVVVSLFSIVFFGGGFFVSNAHADSGVLGVTQISAVQTYASADATYADGWKWTFNVTVPTGETVLQMKFADWTSSAGTIPAENNLQFYSAQSTNASNEAQAIPITASGTYSTSMYLNPTNDLDSNTAGNQIQITLEARIPVGSSGGSYSTSYGINANPDNNPTSTGANPPIIANIQATSTSNGATITWTTNEYGDSEVYFGTASGVYASSTGNLGTVSSGGVYTHSVALSNLNASTTYFYKVASTDSGGNRGASDEYLFATQAAPVGGLTVALNNTLGSQNVSAGTTNLRIGSYALSASSVEGVNVNTVSIQPAPGQSVTPALFQNLKLFVNGTQFGVAQAVVNNSTTYSFSGIAFNIPAGSTVNVDVYADTLSTASGTYAPATSLVSYSGTGGTSFASITGPVNAINGQQISFGASTLTIATDSNNPPSSLIAQNTTGNTLAVFRFTETSNIEAVKVTQMNVIEQVSSSSSNFSNLQLYNGSSLLGTASAPVASGTGVWIYAFNNFTNPLVIPQGSSVSLNLKGDTGSYTGGSIADNSTSTFSISTSTIVARGNTSNKIANVSGSASGNPMTVLRGVETVVGTPLTGMPPASFQEIGGLTITSNAAGDTLPKTLILTFNSTAYNASTTGFLSTVVLHDVNGNAIAASASSTSPVTVTFSPVNYVVTAGSSYTFTIWGDLSQIASIPNASQSLTAQIKANTDYTYLDGSTNGSQINLPTVVVPITVVSLSSPVGGQF